MADLAPNLDQTDPSTTDQFGYSDQQMVSFLQGAGLGSTQQDVQFFEDEEYAQAARGQSGNPFAGFHLPGTNAGDFMQLVSKAEAFEANTGYKSYPSPAMLLQLVNNGGMEMTDQQLYGWLAQQSDKYFGTNIAQTAPWAAIGMSATDWTDRMEQLNTALYSATGQSSWSAAGFSAADLATAIHQGWGTSQIQNYIQQNSSLNSQYGWVKHGMSYQNFLDWKSQNVKMVQQQFGTKATNAQYLQAYENPLQSFGASGTSVTVDPTKQAATGYQSAVR